MKTNTSNIWDTTFASWGAFVDHIETKRWYGASSGWAGGTKEDAFRFARVGWPEQTPKVSELAQRVADRVVEHTALAEATEVNYNVTGAAYDPGAYLSGVPECWLAFEKVEEKCGIRIVIDGTISSGVDKEHKIRMGTAACALILALDGAGHPVTVDLFMGGMYHGYTRKESEKTYIRLQDGLNGAVLDIDRLTFAIAHPLALRGFGLSLWGHGRMQPYFRNEHPEDTKGDFDLWIGGGHLNDCKSWKDGGEAWVLNQYLNQTKD